MEIKANDYKVEMTHEELWKLASSVRNDMYNTLKNHWINHQNAWKEHEKSKIHLLQRMFFALGRPDLFEDIELEAEKIFTAFNKKRGSAK